MLTVVCNEPLRLTMLLDLFYFFIISFLGSPYKDNYVIIKNFVKKHLLRSLFGIYFLLIFLKITSYHKSKFFQFAVSY